jgi:homoserine kinase
VTAIARVRAPATTANLGPGFDCAGVALDLWNEVEVTQGSGQPDRHHLGVRAFELVAPVDGLSLAFSDRIPRLRGLGSSASVIALGLVAACVISGREPHPEELLALGVELEGHADNLAAALAGGVCLTWDGRIERIADDVPAVPIAVIPDSTVSTQEARGLLPDTVPHADATFTAARAALLGAALASGSSGLFAEALDDRLHEPYRAAGAPLLEELRAQPPASALGTTISGSGPTVIVWAATGDVEACADELTRRFPEASALILSVAPRGAHVFEAPRG